MLRYQDRVYTLILRLLGSPEEARDIAQEVFVTVFEKIDSFRGDSQIGTWIYRVATNHAKNRIKYLSRRKDRQQDSFEELAVAPSDGRLSASFPRPDQAFEGQRMRDLIDRALGALDPDQREVVVLRDLDGQSYEAIAEITLQNVGTVKSRLHRGRLRLKEVLEHWMAGRDVLATNPRRGG